MSFVYERGWRQGFTWAGFPGTFLLLLLLLQTSLRHLPLLPDVPCYGVVRAAFVMVQVQMRSTTMRSTICSPLQARCEPGTQINIFSTICTCSGVRATTTAAHQQQHWQSLKTVRT